MKKNGLWLGLLIGGSVLLTRGYAQLKDSSELIFNDSIVHRYNISFYIDTWEDTLKYNKEIADEAYMPCRFTYYLKNGDSIVLDSVGVRYKGNSSYEFAKDSPKKSFKFCFNEYKDQFFFGVERLNLNNGVEDPSYLREKLSYDLARKYMVAPRACFATLSINGQMIGVYTQVEQVDEYFLKRNFEKASGNLYKAGDDGAYLQYKGPNQSSYESVYELKTNRSKNDWSNFINMIYKLNNTTKEEFVPIVSLCLNLDNCIRHLAWTIVLSHFDSYTGSGRNYYMYDDPKSGKFFIIPWDLNMSFGQYPNGWDVIKNSCVNIKNLEQRPLTKRILENDSLKRVYLNYLKEMIKGPFSSENIAKEVDRIVKVID
ncbi:MAG: CotH kinase family protein, partial [Chitinispirillaceae bacterium]|nr:CotH kinase family protein [Chitinispirillaceae bacterium]